MHLDQGMKPADTTCFLKWLTGDPESLVMWQLIHDKKTHALPPKYGRFYEVAEWLRGHQNKGYGVFITINKTNGQGRKTNNIRAIRSYFVDGDGIPMPDTWAKKPTLIVARDATHWHAYWILKEPFFVLEAFRPTQLQLASYYGSDPSVHDLPRVMRAPGTFHQKGDPEIYQIIDGSETRYTHEEIVRAHKISDPLPEATPSTGTTVFPADADQGTRHNLLITHAAQMRNWDYPYEVILAAVSAMAETFDCSDGRTFSEKEIIDIAKWSLTQEADNDIVLAAEGKWIVDNMDMPKPKDGVVGNHQSAELYPDPGEFPEALLNPGGILGGLMGIILQRSHVPQPILALASAIPTFAAAVAGAARTRSGSHPSFLVIGIARSGFGKDAGICIPPQIFSQIPQLFPCLGGGDFASDVGLVSQLAENGRRCYYIDEIGDILKNTKSQGSSTAMLASTFKRLWSRAGGAFFGKVYKDSSQNVVIDPVNVNLYGVTVPNRYYEALTSADIRDGFIPRLLIFQAPDERPASQWPTEVPFPKDLMLALQYWATIKVKDPTIVNYTADAAHLYEDYMAECLERQLADPSEITASIIARSSEHADRLALIKACSRTQTPQITVEDATWAINLARHLLNTQLYNASSRMTETKQEENTVAMLEAIREQKTKGITRSDLTRKFKRFRLNERNDIINTLLESGEIIALKFAAKTKPMLIYYATQYQPQL